MTMTATKTARYYERELKKLGYDARVLRGPAAREYGGEYVAPNFKGAILLAEVGDCCGLHQYLDGCATTPKSLIAAPEGAAFHDFIYSYAAVFEDED